MLEDLKAQVCQANIDLGPSGLVKLTWGNVSGIDRDKGIFGIKPSGVDYSDVRPEHIVLVDIDGQVVEGELKPSYDTKTHLEFYKAWEGIGGVTHVEVKDLTGTKDHFEAVIVADAFDGLSRVKQHQLVYAALDTELNRHGTILHSLNDHIHTLLLTSLQTHRSCLSSLSPKTCLVHTVKDIR